MGGRSVSNGDYRYGFNGKEKDDKGEWGGEYLTSTTCCDSEGNVIINYTLQKSQTYYDYGFRIYNPGIGKFLSVDPLTQEYPWYTPYQFAGNKPIQAIDLDGLEEQEVTGADNTNYVANSSVIPTVVADDPEMHSDTHSERYGTQGDMEAWKKRNGYEGMSDAQARQAWADLEGENFDSDVEIWDQIERARVAVKKMQFFTAPFVAIEDVAKVYGGNVAVSAFTRGSSMFAGRLIQSPLTGNVLVSGRVSWGMGGKLNYANLSVTPKGFKSINSLGGKSNCVSCMRLTHELLTSGKASVAPIHKGVDFDSFAAFNGLKVKGGLDGINHTELISKLSKLPHGSSIGIRQIGYGQAHAFNAINEHGFVRFLDGQRGISFGEITLKNKYLGTFQYVNLTGKI